MALCKHKSVYTVSRSNVHDQNSITTRAGSKNFQLLTYWTALCITALTTWLERCLHIIYSLAATSASSTVHPRAILLMSFWMTSCHDVFGWPGSLFLWDGFQSYSLLGVRSMFIYSKWPDHWRRHFLITAVSWGCLVHGLDMELFIICGDHTTSKILHWQCMSKASSLALLHYFQWGVQTLLKKKNGDTCEPTHSLGACQGALP